MATKKNGKTNVIFIIDESGSMAVKAADVIGGFNTYLDTLSKDDGDYSLTVTFFNTVTRTWMRAVSLAKVPQLDAEYYQPGGNTALYDAVGTTLREVNYAFGGGKDAPDKPYGTEKVLCVIMTDGEENSSHRFTDSEVKDQIERRTANGNWTFVFLGQGTAQWVKRQAGAMGINAGNAMHTGARGATVGMTYSNLAGATATRSASLRASSPTFFADANQSATDYADKPDTTVKKPRRKPVKKS